MSLYDICYVNNTAEQERLKVQQKQIQKALQELSVSTKIQEKEEKERLITRQYLTKAPLSSRFELWMSSMDCFIGDESRPYSPYYDATVVPSNSSATSVMDDIASSFHSNLLRQRTPSMVSSASLTSNNSSQNTSHEYMDEAYQYTSILDVSER
jgi:hypothetical protein